MAHLERSAFLEHHGYSLPRERSNSRPVREFAPHRDQLFSKVEVAGGGSGHAVPLLQSGMRGSERGRAFISRSEIWARFVGVTFPSNRPNLSPTNRPAEQGARANVHIGHASCYLTLFRNEAANRNQN